MSTFPGRDARRRIRPWTLLVLVIVVSLVTNVVHQVAARAAVPSDPGSTALPMSFFNVPTFTTSGNPSIYLATDAQAAALRGLEQDAVDGVRADFGLPASDFTAVRGWARDLVRARMWAMVLKIMAAPPDQRSSQDAQVYTWLQNVQKAEAIKGARAAIGQYNKWSGDTSWTAFDQANPNSPKNYAQPATPGGTDWTTGYCLYHPPGALDTTDQYNGRSNQTCFTPCTNELGCAPPTPTFESFQAWGNAVVYDELVGTPTLANISRDTAIALGFAGAVVGAAVTGVALSATLGSVLGGTVLSAALFPFAGISAATAAAAGSAAAVAGAGSAAITGAMTASAVGATVTAAIIAIAVAVLQGIKVSDALALPGRLNQQLADAKASTGQDLSSVVATPDGMRGLYTLFIGATVPDEGTPPAPAPSAPTNPRWTIRPQDQVSGAPGIDTLSTRSPYGKVLTTRLVGKWFVHSTTDADGQPVQVQSLSMPYVDWSGEVWTAWRLDTDGTHRFVSVRQADASGVDPAHCSTDGRCLVSDHLNVLGADGKHLQASIEDNVAPSLETFTLGGTVVAEGDSLPFQPVGWDIEGDPVTVTYTWPVGCAPRAVLCLGNGPHATVTGALGTTTRLTFAHSGPTVVTTTADDGHGGVTATTTPVTVTNVAPTISLDESPTPVQPGEPATITGTILDADPGDLERLTLDWGDGTSVSGDDKDCAPVCPSRDITFADTTGGVTFSASHAWNGDGGNRTITATVTDGQSDPVSTSRTVQLADAPATLVLSASAVSEGQETQLTGVVTDPGASDTFTGTVNWGDGTSTPLGLPSETKTFTLRHSYAAYSPSSTGWPVKVTLTDAHGNVTSGTAGAKVNDVAPTVTMDPGAVAEGGTFIERVSFTDPGVGDTHVVTIQWGDGTSDTKTPQVGARYVDFSHVYQDDPPGPNDDVQVSADVSDGAARGAAETTVTVRNAAPIVQGQFLDLTGQPMTGSDSAVTGTPFTLAAVLDDPGVLDTLTTVVKWGDGTTTNYTGRGNVPFAHTYTTAGSYFVSATITDDDGGIGTNGGPVTVVTPGQALATEVAALRSAASSGSSSTVRTAARLALVRLNHGNIAAFRRNHPSAKQWKDAVTQIDRARAALTPVSALSGDDRRLFLIERSAVTHAVASLTDQATAQALLDKGDAAAAKGDLKTASAYYLKAISLS